MATFESELPTELLKEIEKLYADTDKMCGDMTKAGAKVAKSLIDSSINNAFKDASSLRKCLKTTKVYKTADGAINTKVAFYGYFKNKQGAVVPAPLVAAAREYGTSRGEAKKPFMRQAFTSADIERAMKEVEKKYLPQE